MGRPAARVGVFTEPKPGTWKHSELKASTEEHGQLFLRSAAGLPHVGVNHITGLAFKAASMKMFINILIYFYFA